MDKDHDQFPRISNTPTAKSYALSGKIMLSAIVVLFFVVVLMVILHLYAKLYLLRARRRRQLLQRRNRMNNPRRAHIVFYVDNNPTSLALHEPVNNGLEPAVIASLPIFVYNPKTHPKEMDCAVCLSEFEENEKGRLLPKCNHSFHVQCIDMWFHSHSTCPICRAPVEPVPIAPEGMIIEPGSSSSSMWSRRKGLDLTGVRIDIPNRNELETELSLSSPASHGFRSPVTQLFSLKRILSMGRKTPGASNTPTTSCGVGTSCSTSGVAAELDLEGGPSELTQPQGLTPR